MPDDQYDPHPVGDADLARWQEWADAAVPVMRPGSFNWPVVVRSLIAEVRRLKLAAKDG